LAVIAAASGAVLLAAAVAAGVIVSRMPEVSEGASGATPSTSPHPSSSEKPESTATPTTTSSVTPTATPAVTQPPTTSPPVPPGACGSFTAGSTYAACGFPSASSAGIPTAAVLAAQETTGPGGLVITADNTVIDGRTIKGWVDVRANNVIIQNSLITSQSWTAVKIASGKSGFKFLHNKLVGEPANGTQTDYGVATLGNDFIEVGWNDMSGVKEAVTGSSANVHDNFIHDLRAYAGAHTQCIYIYSGGSGVTVTHNTLLNQVGQANTTAAIYIAPDSANQKNHLIQSNWLSGGAYTVYGGDQNAQNIRFIGNAFSTEIFPPAGSLYGPVGYWHGGNAGNVWGDNRWANGMYANSTVSP
jgi:hypothetical protein